MQKIPDESVWNRYSGFFCRWISFLFCIVTVDFCGNVTVDFLLVSSFSMLGIVTVEFLQRPKPGLSPVYSKPQLENCHLDISFQDPKSKIEFSQFTFTVSATTVSSKSVPMFDKFLP